MTRKLKRTTQSKMQYKQELLSSFEVREIIKIGSESNQLFSLRSASRGSSVLFRFILRTTDPSSAAILTACLAEHDGMGSYTQACNASTQTFHVPRSVHHTKHGLYQGGAHGTGLGWTNFPPCLPSRCWLGATLRSLITLSRARLK